MSHPYYQRRLVTCRRILPDENRPALTAFPQTFGPKIKRTTEAPDTTVCTQCYHVTDHATDPSGHYYIQVGLFRHAPEAAFLEHLRVSGYGHDVRSIQRNGQPLTQVLVGPFATREKARNALPDTQALFNPGAFVVTTGSATAPR